MDFLNRAGRAMPFLNRHAGTRLSDGMGMNGDIDQAYIVDAMKMLDLLKTEELHNEYALELV
jgi:hypothetical protein